MICPRDTRLPPAPPARPTLPVAPQEPYPVICQRARERLLAEWREAEHLLDQEASEP